jgi:hypothetical protein
LAYTDLEGVTITAKRFRGRSIMKWAQEMMQMEESRSTPAERDGGPVLPHFPFFKEILIIIIPFYSVQKYSLSPGMCPLKMLNNSML